MPNQLFVIKYLNEVMGDYIFRRDNYSDIFCDQGFRDLLNQYENDNNI